MCNLKLLFTAFISIVIKLCCISNNFCSSPNFSAKQHDLKSVELLLPLIFFFPLPMHVQLNSSSEPWVGVEEEMLVGGLHPWRNYSFEVGYPSPVGLGAVWANCPTTHCYTLQGSKHCTHDLYPCMLIRPCVHFPYS